MSSRGPWFPIVGIASSLVIAAVLSVADGGAAEGARKARTAERAGVWARVTWTEGWDFPLAHLVIVRRGKRLFEATIRDPETRNGCCPEPRDLRVHDLDSDGEPEVLLTLSHGGAHDRVFSLFLTYDAANAYRMLSHEWAEPRPIRRDLNGDGAIEFIARDTRFSYVFASFAGSVWPVQVWTYRDGLLTNTTRGYRSLIREHSNELWRYHRRGSIPDSRGLLAAYQAEKYLLGEEQDGWRRLQRAVARGRLGAPQQRCSLGRYDHPSGRCYLRKLRRFLRETGYAR